jgi:hypothetical protein
MKIEDDELKKIGIPDPVSIDTECVDKNGKPIENKKEAYAYCSNADGHLSYFIKYSRGELADPHNTYVSSALSKKLSTFKRVTADTYKNYVKFLQTKNTLYYTRARRNLM